MRPVRRNTGMLLVTVVLLTLTTGCPQNQSTLKIYAVNVHTTYDLTSLQVENQETGEFEELLGEPVPPLVFELIEVPLAPYATSTGTIVAKGALGGEFRFASQVINETPLAVVLSGGQGGEVIRRARAGASLSKLLPDDSVTLEE